MIATGWLQVGYKLLRGWLEVDIKESLLIWLKHTLVAVLFCDSSLLNTSTAMEECS